MLLLVLVDSLISIHAPLRERLNLIRFTLIVVLFQSTLPYGSDLSPCEIGRLASDFNPRSLTGATVVLLTFPLLLLYFNPRSLTGATYSRTLVAYYVSISIHALLRERRGVIFASSNTALFQSTLPYGSDPKPLVPYSPVAAISIHAPLRERRTTTSGTLIPTLFQSTLPYGSD